MTIVKTADTVDMLLAGYRRWAIAATCSFLLFTAVLATVVILQRMHFIMLFMLLLSGFLWIGFTSISRHAFIVLKRYIKVDVRPLEFLSTQLVFIHFPVMYGKIKKEAHLFREKIVTAENEYR